ncbi:MULTISPECIES: M28 family metallopeptidase [Clostridium]|uniref:Aminopeptidase YwaD n=2 Tax=Clostridium TaxID=1485 RepID=A0A151AP63_9CLOT|nr:MULTISPECIES: M28 family metallopeptidase [Clostridium]KYH29350.1 aminopeptidase YwaD precursor [Clostridium colicanis DSM 13634]MBE6043122.1 Zn-dependent exopeptidase M28 [Clostridium thermopalmarium]PRR70868.1 Aminopeptidase YwaD precursor [Clostridium thermopalmarium DSM 5974]PVZ28792.1 peptidase M28-like protein [Clostridium thermopalmarium DSM 5974]
MKKIIVSFLFSISLIVFFISLKFYITVHPFNSQEVFNTINFLCSDNFKGRLTGTLENREVEEYIKLKFIENNLKPFMGEYTQTFKVQYPKRIEGNPYLTVSDDDGNIIRKFEYGKDYKEDMLNFKSNKFSFNKNNPQINSKDNVIQIKDNLDYFLIYIPSKEGLNFRSSFINSSHWSMCIMVTEPTLKYIKKYIDDGYTINCFIPFTAKEALANNVMGYIEGKDKAADPIILSAHFDHLGSDLNNTIYRGALDNASGTSFMLEMAKYISSLGQPKRSILFVGFNAEEFGCIGSTEFVKKYKNYIQNSKVFNFDMIGSDNGVPLCIVGGPQDTTKTAFLRSVSDTCSDEKIYFNYKFGSDSDHKAFRENKIDAVTFCDNDTSRIHTPMDKPEFISTTAIDRCFNVVSREVIKYAFGNNLLILYYKETLIGSSLVILTTVIAFIYSKRKKNYNLSN